MTKDYQSIVRSFKEITEVERDGWIINITGLNENGVEICKHIQYVNMEVAMEVSKILEMFIGINK